MTIGILRCLALGLAVCFATAASGDIVELAGGGRIEGTLVETPDDNSRFVIELDRGGRITVARSNVTRIDSTSAEQLEYQAMARALPDTVESHWKMAEWCRQHKLADEARNHLHRIVELEPNHEEARTALGFRKRGGQWVTRDEVMAARGMVLYEGRYVTPQHVELLERQKIEKVVKADWANNLDRLRRWLTGRNPNRVTEARREIQAIHDPEAAEAVVAMLRREDVPELRRVWVDVASRIDHQLTVDALVNLSLNDPDPELRIQCLDHLIDSGRTGLVAPYVRALKSRNNEIVNRAAAALGRVGEIDAMGPLIDALITKHTFKISDANPGQQGYTFSPDGSAFSFGGGGPQVVTRELRNPSVLSALVTLAGGTSFDYDQVQWRRWLVAQSKLHAVDVRRDQ